MIRILFRVSYTFFVCSLCGCKDSVDREFEWLETFLDFKGRDVKCLRDWYKIYHITKQDRMNLLSADFSDMHYTVWKTYRSSFSFPDGYSINGREKNIMWMQKLGSDGHDGMYVFLDLSRNELILVTAGTYGL